MTRTADIFRPVSEPRIIENAFTADQHRRMLDVVRREGPWSLILAQHFKSPEEVVATTSGKMPEGFTPTWDMFLTPVFRGYFAQGHTALHSEIEDCFLNQQFLDLVRGYWGAAYARPESMLFNIQGPCPGTDTPHVDATRFRGISYQTTPVWLMNMMVKSGLFKRWQAKKAQVIAWYYQGKVGGGFNYWPDGLSAPPKQVKAPMWGRAVVVENEMMYHTAEACGPAALRRPEGLSIQSVMEPDPEAAGGWQILTDGRVIQRVPEEEFRLLVHWGADIFMDYEELRMTLDHTDDIGHERIFDMLIADLRARDITFEVPSDPLIDTAFITLLTEVYDPGKPALFPPEPEEALAA
ncbi:hypothetical protein [Parafrankia sp. BMG5.11]|uniref:hypothetical protein n=1 Tax=Parafrankia sp. BMG5.11 TaxID=222540 RepID=UPI001039E8B7|nr:hypothetical protein [Parafrankia sp. BMG5.11]TCJ37011.1 hypothetical protein E0504_18115 [Parafrankia sp. BMG5.11]